MEEMTFCYPAAILHLLGSAAPTRGGSRIEVISVEFDCVASGNALMFVAVALQCHG